MRNGMKYRVGVGSTVTLGVVGLSVAYVLSCTSAPLPFVVTGPGGVGNDPPTLSITEPTSNLTIGQGDLFLIAWNDSDRDDDARIRFELLSTTSADRILLITGIAENPDVPAQSTHTVSTNLLPIDSYNLLGVIDDGVNPPVETFAMDAGTTAQRLVINIVDEGTGPQTVPPVVTVTEPAFNQSVAQNDMLNILVQPAAFFDANPANAANNPPFDQDSNATLFIVLDFDLDPNNDDPANPDPSQIILLDTRTITAMDNGQIPVPITIDLGQIPPRADGQPYNIRATITDATNPSVHSYAPGTISVVRLAAGVVDLFDLGRTTSGAVFKGFNPGANLGSSISSVSDFDIDGTDDFIMAAQFGNPQNAGPVGEAYLVYGQPQTRFGSTIPVNSISNSVSGVVFQAPPVRTQAIPGAGARTDGITDVSFIRDQSGDGRPELLFGLGHVHGAYDGTDYDPADDEETPTLFTAFCYPDQLVNNITDVEADFEFYAGGMAVIVNSSIRDNSGLILNPSGGGRANLPRLDFTAVTLELAGQTPRILDSSGESTVGNFFARADNVSVLPLGTDPEEAGRIAGARFIAGGYDFFTQFEPPREGLFGQTFRSLGDLTADTIDEFVISAPLNERHLADLQTSFGFGSTHVASTRFTGSILIAPGTNYNTTLWRDRNTEGGTSTIPFLDHWQFAPFGSCTSTPTTPRGYVIPADAFELFAEDIDDFLGDGQSAGDFNQDGLDDILCGAPLNDRSGSLLDSGVTYVIYGRNVFGEVRLANADNALTRPPMLRIRGLRRGDQIGRQQAAGLDVNGDRIDDVFIGSPRTDFGGIERATCGEDFTGDGVVDSGDFDLTSFNTCVSQLGDEVFTSDTCKVFDYDNDGDIDEDDRCVFCCLSGDCEPEDECVFGQGQDCCGDVADNGFVGIVFGGQFIDGDRTIAQLATDQLPGTVFFGSGAGHRAGGDISSAGDFNQDGFGDILITAPGETRLDSAGRERLGVVYLVFGGTHLTNTTWNLKDVGTVQLPGIVFLSPFVKGRPNEAPPQTVAFIGDINDDGFGDIAIGNPAADFIDSTFPQGPDAPGSDPSTGRRSNVGDVYVIYGNNFGPNRETP